MKESSLAIIIPAYKRKYLKQSIESMLAQTNRSFRLYIFDDNSPEDLDAIVSPYLTDDHVVYHQFDQNMGGTSLVKHWQRCIEMTTEPWVWLFSDDDLASSNCVEALQKAITSNSEVEVFRFQRHLIDGNDQLIDTPEVPEFQTGQELAKAVILKKQGLTMPEYVFNRQAYKRHDGFVDFDLAWGTDIAAWVQFSHPYGIRTIKEATVSYRMSDQNISSIDNSAFFRRKLMARVAFMRWFENQTSYHFTHEGRIHSDYLKDNILWYIKGNGRNLTTLDLFWLLFNLPKTLDLNILQVMKLLIQTKR